jgi:hypothetical protein
VHGDTGRSPCKRAWAPSATALTSLEDVLVMPLTPLAADKALTLISLHAVEREAPTAASGLGTSHKV